MAALLEQSGHLRARLQPDVLGCDIHQALKRKESDLRLFTGRSPHLDLRPHVVDWMSLICTRFRLASVTLHTAVRYYDDFTDKVDVPRDGLKLAALACVMLGAKWEEKEVDIPTLDGLLVQARGAYTRAELRLMELVILESNGWNMTSVVSEAFVDFYTLNSITAQDTVFGAPSTNVLTLFTAVKQGATTFLEASLREANVNRFPPSMVGAAAVLLSRKKSHVEPYWPASAVKASGLTVDALVRCVRSVFKQHLQLTEPGFAAAVASSKRVESPVTAMEAAQETMGGIQRSPLASPPGLRHPGMALCSSPAPRILSPVPFLGGAQAQRQPSPGASSSTSGSSSPTASLTRQFGGMDVDAMDSAGDDAQLFTRV